MQAEYSLLKEKQEQKLKYRVLSASKFAFDHKERDIPDFDEKDSEDEDDM